MLATGAQRIQAPSIIPGAVVGGLAAVAIARALSTMMSRLMSGFINAMAAQMRTAGCSTAEL